MPGQVDIVRLLLEENLDTALTTVYLSFSDEHGKVYSLSPALCTCLKAGQGQESGGVEHNGLQFAI
jgi:hypothetical protein